MKSVATVATAKQKSWCDRAPTSVRRQVRTCHKDYRPEGYSRSRGVELVIADSAECIELMREFIAAHPELWNEDIGEK